MVVLVSPLTLYRPSATVLFVYLFLFVLKLIFSKNAFQMMDFKKFIMRSSDLSVKLCQNSVGVVKLSWRGRTELVW